MQLCMLLVRWKHSIESGENIRAGACYWNGSKYVAGPVADTEHDVPLSGAQMAVADLVDGKTYYGYVKERLQFWGLCL